ncbi:hypothetical protein A2348_03780 [Candidatus Uhrbacteria bacterium RIFOXYB12_FULL_58_10]|uniref:Peptidase M20 dimerisation domain-containing protein n=1 Tax=Candidatus Uhrbacteria bacterium RIFOXYB2_FULL_57_15 TaxID=1802422 RepID=A0A1F7W9D1_9BACT|nr:MAG: hypothetical protein A2348_03780 [Candidatus Uhrbacteria bacterium RIFOXYB12_FULL_58_10]OGL99421.1 MAG: hypothetical protein A2304_01355 [Candidatus Uhrbacteria bacterium RIFOXYB2_FULL_57_15]OGL99864.1 MAG: hypothetical protein A2501_05560 [Candidatus Uhrbacteria bacterium RIFOXYC12_FULL_57_11]
MILTQPEQLLLDLLAIPSVSGTEQAIIDRVAETLGGTFRVERIPVDETRSNLLCTVGSPRVLLAAHLDTVPGTVEIRVDDENIHGRGACDNKGAAAAMITAALQAVSEDATDFGLLFTVGEETNFDGAIAVQKFFADNDIVPERIVIGEPTGLQIVTAQRGITSVEILCDGTAEHSSTDHPDSAIHKLAALLAAFLKNTFPETTYHVGLIQGGTADNVVAAHATATLLFRSMNPELETLIHRALADTNVPHTIKTLQTVPPVDHTAPSFARNAVAYFTEMAFLKNSFVLGPGSITDAHTASERVSRRELNEAVAQYRAFLPKRD